VFIVTMQCDICNNKQQMYTGTDLLLPVVKVKALLKETGWIIRDGKEFCTDCTRKLDRMQDRIRKGVN